MAPRQATSGWRWYSNPCRPQQQERCFGLVGHGRPGLGEGAGVVCRAAFARLVARVHGAGRNHSAVGGLGFRECEVGVGVMETAYSLTA